MKNAGSLGILDVTFALEAPGVAANYEFDVMLALDGKVKPFECVESPVGFVIVRVALPVLQQGEADFALFLGRLHGPASALRLRLSREEGEGANQQD